MENATKALLMAAGMLLGILIISLAVTMFNSTGELGKTYNSSLSQEEITIFNSNFTKRMKDLTIHEVVTICNFALNNGIYKLSESNIVGKKTVSDINNTTMNKKYTLTILNYDNGFINSIKIEEQP